MKCLMALEMPRKTEIKGHHVYKYIWSLNLGEDLEVHCEPDNLVGQVCSLSKNY